MVSLSDATLCRCCMLSGDTVKMRSVFSQVPESNALSQLADKLQYAVGLMVKEDDNLPHYMCFECYTKVCAAEKFKRLCLETDMKLRKELLKIDKENKNLCSFCNINTVNSSYCIDHQQCHLNPYQCSLCLQRYSSPELLSTHVNQEHYFKTKESTTQSAEGAFEVMIEKSEYLEEPVVTFIEESQFDNGDIDEFQNDDSDIQQNDICSQIKTEIEQTYVCESCHKMIPTTEDLERHLIEEHGSVNRFMPVKLKKNYLKEKRPKKNTGPNSEDVVTCEECKSTFKNLKAYKIHTIRKHRKSKIKEENNDLVNNDLCCGVCERKFTKKSSLEAHRFKHKMDYLPYKCSLCERQFKHEAHLHNHVGSAHLGADAALIAGARPLPCEQCGTVVPGLEAMALHKLAHARLPNKHRCPHCDKSFKMLSTLKDHVRVHTGERPYLCSTCGRRFTQKTNLKEHMRRHQGLKPFACASCTLAFVSKGELTAHERVHSGAHPFKCVACSARFTTSSSLAKHRRTHTGERPYACAHCPMRFAALSTLRNHKRTHTGEKPYKCKVCDKCFGQRNDLASHERSHSGERPYSCAHCPAAFRHAAALRHHAAATHAAATHAAATHAAATHAAATHAAATHAAATPEVQSPQALVIASSAALQAPYSTDPPS